LSEIFLNDSRLEMNRNMNFQSFIRPKMTFSKENPPERR